MRTRETIMPGKAAAPAWQSRTRPVDAAELRLAEELESILGDGIHDLAGIVEELQRRGIPLTDGSAPTEKSFIEEMKRLGAGNGLLSQSTEDLNVNGADLNAGT